MATLQERYADALLERAIERSHLTPDFMDRIERSLATSDQLAQYVAILIAHVERFAYPSGQIMNRISRILERVAAA